MRNIEKYWAGETVSGSDNLSFVDLLSDDAFLSLLPEFSDRSAQGVARALVEAHIARKKPTLKAISEGQPLEGEYPIEVVNGGQLLLVGVWHAYFFASEIHPEYRKTIFRTVENNPRQWFVEEGLAAHFGLTDLDYVTELTDLEVFTGWLGNNVSGGIFKSLLGLTKESWQALKNMVHMMKIADEQVAKMRGSLSRKRKRDYRFTKNAYTFLSELKLPEPLDMEVKYILGNPTCGLDYSIDRSKIQAEQIRGCLAKGMFGGLVAGAEHISQVKYFFENPDYDPREVVRKTIEFLG
ncbi:hypothetical protein HYZ70_02735 [Candidatus Curtissbacteria bacterium]|nr:hypothetical protein [Candidatus Curtissbacteria bacterium]